MKPTLFVALLFISGTLLAQGVDPGYDGYRGWGDPTGMGVPHYCRVIGTPGNYTLSCWNPLTRKSIESGSVDRGYPWGAAWVDVNGDGKTDYCRILGSDEKPRLACNLATGTGFGGTLQSPVFTDAGYHDMRGWYGRKGVAWYCRGVGDHNRPQISCQTFTILNGALILK
jgi:hypothetical protein